MSIVPEEKHTIIKALCMGMLASVVGTEYLVYVAVTADTAIEPAAVALIGVVGQVSTLLIGGLIGMVVGRHMKPEAAVAEDPDV